MCLMHQVKGRMNYQESNSEQVLFFHSMKVKLNEFQGSVWR